MMGRLRTRRLIFVCGKLRGIFPSVVYPFSLRYSESHFLLENVIRNIVFNANANFFTAFPTSGSEA